MGNQSLVPNHPLAKQAMQNLKSLWRFRPPAEFNNSRLKCIIGDRRVKVEVLNDKFIRRPIANSPFLRHLPGTFFYGRPLQNMKSHRPIQQIISLPELRLFLIFAAGKLV